jgi:hypothetical protein
MQHSPAVGCVPSWGKRVVCHRQIVSTVVEKVDEPREIGQTRAKMPYQDAKIAQAR